MTADELITKRFLEQEEQIKELKKKINDEITSKNSIIKILNMCLKFGDAKMINTIEQNKAQFGFIVTLDSNLLYKEPELRDLAKRYVKILETNCNTYKEEELIAEEE